VVTQHLQHALQFTQHIASGNANYGQPQSIKKIIPLPVIVRFAIVRISIYFNHNTAIHTVKIHNVVAYDFLPIKIQAFKFSLVELLPQQNFA